MAKTFAIRVFAPQLAPALRAAAPFIDLDTPTLTVVSDDEVDAA